MHPIIALYQVHPVHLGCPLRPEEIISKEFDGLSKTGIEFEAALKTKRSTAKANE